MSENTLEPEEQDPSEVPPEAEPDAEPEGGPMERAREFLRERLTPLRPKEEAPGEQPVPPLIGLAPERTVEEPEEMLDAAEERRRALEEFRRRRRESASGAGEEPSLDEGGIPPPPEPIDNPPANNWIPLGPTVLRQGQGGVKPATSGRTPAIAVAPGGNRLYIGAANGGVWRSDDSGQTWHSLMESFDLNPTTPASDSLSVGAIAIDLANPDRVYVGSGEGAGAAYFGVGPIVTDNGTSGAPSWITESVAPGSDTLAGTAFYALAVDPANADRVVGATYRGIYRREPVDPANPAAGFHWAQKTMGGLTNQRVTSVVVATGGGATMFYAARHNGPVFASNDGHAWMEIGTGFPAFAQRISLAVRADNPNIVYALLQSGAVWRLDTADGVWRDISGVPAGFTGTQGWYDLAIAVAPDNVNRVYLGGSTIFSGGDWSGSLFRGEVTVSGASVSMVATYIGNSVHADIHTIVFAPGDANKMWVGCDGGVFYSTNPTGSGDIFVSRNTGLQTMTNQFLGQHPTEDAVLFAGSQDNGGERFTGEEAWLYSSGGDGGFAIINWHNPYMVLSTYVYGGIRRSLDGGTRYSYGDVSVPLAGGESVLFYAPIAGTPPDPASPTPAPDADLVAFGSIRPWISTTFGGGWQSIPTNTLAGDSLDARIKSLAFASANRLYAGTMSGGVYRFDRAGAAWTRTRIDTLGGANQLPLAGPITDIAVDPTNSSRIYVTFGGTGDYRHVWFFDGAQWEQRSGPFAGSFDSLLDVQANAIAVDPANAAHLYMGTDIGMWRSLDDGATWEPYSQGLPDAAVLDIALHNPRRLLRAATHGRGVWERTIPDGVKQGVELYVRDTQLDQGRFTTTNGLPDPTAIGQTVRHWAGPDIKLDTPNAMGQYQFPLTGTIDFHQFVDTLSDDAQSVATHATATITTRVYVQVHNRGVVPANGVQVMLLLANASAGLPALPAGYWVNVQSGLPISNADWRTVGTVILDDVRVGAPKVAAFDLTSDMLPPPANLAGNQHQCVLALLHHPSDPYTSTITNTDDNSRAERKAAHKNLHVVQFSGMLPAPPVMIPFRLHNADLEQERMVGLSIYLDGYPAAGRLYTAPPATAQPLEESIHGLEIVDDMAPFKHWAEAHVRMVEENLESNTPYDREWSAQRLQDIQQVMEGGLALRAGPDTALAQVRDIQMPPNSFHTIFLTLDRPENGQIGDSYVVDIEQTGAGLRDVTGGLRLRVELVKEPEVEAYKLELWQTKWLFGYTVLRSRLYDPAGRHLTPADDATVHVLILDRDRWYEAPMRWHRTWRSFYYFMRRPNVSRIIATASIHGFKVVEAHLAQPEVESLAAAAGEAMLES